MATAHTASTTSAAEVQATTGDAQAESWDRTARTEERVRDRNGKVIEGFRVSGARSEGNIGANLGPDDATAAIVPEHWEKTTHPLPLAIFQR
jgi:hypothetical protein